VKEGEVMLDLGSGAGKLCYIISQVVGSSGRAIGIDMNDEMLALARKYKNIIGNRLGYHNVDFKKAKIQNLKLDLEKVNEYLKKHPVTSSDDLIRLNEFIEYLEKTDPLIPDNSIDVVVSNCVLNLVKPEDKSMLFSEIYRVLKNGGRAVISDIVSDEDVPVYMQNDPELWSGCISGAFREDLFIKTFEDAGFYGVNILKHDNRPWRTVDGIEFKSMTVVAYKGKEGPCIDYNQAVIYRGPYSEIKDDDGHVFERGRRIAVCEKTFNILKRIPYMDDFIFIEPYEKLEPRPFPCGKGVIYRHPSETKGAELRITDNDSVCCPTGQCDRFEPFALRLSRTKKRLTKDTINAIQVNIGNLCNQSCIHCHVEASPEGRNVMPWEVMEKIISLIKKNQGLVVDITGGAPELHPKITDFISMCSNYTESIIMRSNLTALLQRLELLHILKDHGVTLICSLPDISDKKTDYQRGEGVFKDSIKALKILNEHGYSYELPLHLVHNPAGTVLPEIQEIVSEKYKSHLKEKYGIILNNLLILNNMPIGRFKRLLERSNGYKQYMETLYLNFNPSTIDNLMCRNLINIGYDGRVYDCDFNNALNLPIEPSIDDDILEKVFGKDIIIRDHCYGCTAMKGSGCYGSVIK